MTRQRNEPRRGEGAADGKEAAIDRPISGRRRRSRRLLEKLEFCLHCEAFCSAAESAAMYDWFAAIRDQFGEYRRTAEEKIRRLEQLAERDPVAGVYNRRKLVEVLRREVERARRYNQDLSVAMFDLDRFKQLNDRRGHAAGDRALRLTAETVQRRLRQPDMIFRFGGDEFFIVFPQTEMAGAVEAAEDLRQRIARRTREAGNPVTASFGVASRQAGDNFMTLIERADRGLYRAKELGRNRVETCSTPTPDGLPLAAHIATDAGVVVGNAAE